MQQKRPCSQRHVLQRYGRRWQDTTIILRWMGECDLPIIIQAVQKNLAEQTWCYGNWGPFRNKKTTSTQKKLSKCLLEEISRYNKYTFMHLKKTLKIRLNINFTSVEYWEKDRNISPDSESISEETKIRTKQEFEWQKK